MVVDRKKIDLGIKCIAGWGFNYHQYIPMQNSVVLIGVRGVAGYEINIDITIKDIDDLCSFAEDTSSAPYILIGKIPNRNNWEHCNG